MLLAVFFSGCCDKRSYFNNKKDYCNSLALYKDYHNSLHMSRRLCQGIFIENTCDQGSSKLCQNCENNKYRYGCKSVMGMIY